MLIAKYQAEDLKQKLMRRWGITGAETIPLDLIGSLKDDKTSGVALLLDSRRAVDEESWHAEL